MVSFNRQALGKQAEQQACAFLQSKGLRRLCENFRCKLGEIDLVMQDQEDIVFVEVRSRSSTTHGTAAESIHQRKRRHLVRAAVYYLQQKKWLYKVNCRFDVIAIQRLPDGTQLQWFKNAFSIETMHL